MQCYFSGWHPNQPTILDTGVYSNHNSDPKVKIISSLGKRSLWRNFAPFYNNKPTNTVQCFFEKVVTAAGLPFTNTYSSVSPFFSFTSLSYTSTSGNFHSTYIFHQSKLLSTHDSARTTAMFLSITSSLIHKQVSTHSLPSVISLSFQDPNSRPANAV